MVLDLEQGWGAGSSGQLSFDPCIQYRRCRVRRSMTYDFGGSRNSVTIDGGIYAVVGMVAAQVDPVFYQEVHNISVDVEWPYRSLHWAPITFDGNPHVVGHYQPETVVDLAALLDRAAELGVDRALWLKADGCYGRSILDMQQDSRGWTHERMRL